MKMDTCSEKYGSTLIMTLVLLVTSCMVIGAVAIYTSTNSRNLKTTINRDRTFYLADAGLSVAMNRAENDLSPTISLTESQTFFSDHSVFDGGGMVANASAQSAAASSSTQSSGNWGFNTSIENINGRTNRLIAGADFAGTLQAAQVDCVDEGTETSLNFIYRLVVYSAKMGGLFQVSGHGDEADFVNGDVYVRGSIEVTGDARLRHGELDYNKNGLLEPGESWKEAYAVGYYGPMTRQAFDAHCDSVDQYNDLIYGNGEYDPGEAFCDDFGNGVYDENEEFTDLNGDGEYTPGDTTVDNGNGKWNAGENWVDDSEHELRQNGQYDQANGYHDGSGCWNDSYEVKEWAEGWYRQNCHKWRWGWCYSWNTYSCAGWPAESFEDLGDTTYTEPEPFVDVNGVYDEGEDYLDDRNGDFDWGTMASGLITGMDIADESLGIRNALGGNRVIEPPDLERMHYDRPKTGSAAAFSYEGWGHDFAVTASDYSSNGHVINNTSQAEHIFVRNVPDNDPDRGNDYYRKTYGGVTVRSRGYELVYDNDGNRIDDYFMEDPTDSYYASYDTDNEIDGTTHTAPSYINVKPEHNNKVYYVDGNLYLHGTPTWSYRFKEPGTRITIIANGNITISDEFYYNADYDPNLGEDDIDSTIIKNPSDALCLIALKNPECTNDSGNIYIGDAAKGTGGSIHAMMYAENDFIDNNIGGSGQAFISIYGNMAAGGELAIHRDSWDWTRLDVTLDRRLSRSEIIVQGLPPAPAGTVFIGNDGVPDWKILPGTWKSASIINK